MNAQVGADLVNFCVDDYIQKMSDYADVLGTRQINHQENTESG